MGDSGIVTYGLNKDGRSLDENGTIFRIMESIRYRGKLILSRMKMRRKSVEKCIKEEGKFK